MFTCYWDFDDLTTCRLGVAYTMTHFSLLAYTLLRCYLQETAAAADIATWNMAPSPLPVLERALAVYAGPYFALLLPSELITIIMEHLDGWQANRAHLLIALCLIAGNI